MVWADNFCLLSDNQETLRDMKNELAQKFQKLGMETKLESPWWSKQLQEMGRPLTGETEERSALSGSLFGNGKIDFRGGEKESGATMLVLDLA